MPSILIKNVPAKLHRQLKKQAENHHRSMNREILALLESAVPLPPPKKVTIPVAIKPRFPMTSAEREAAINEGRA
jgi:plasmid stability protein